MKRRAAVHARCGRIESVADHEIGGIELLVEDRERKAAVVFTRQRGQERRVFLDDRLDPALVGRLERVEEADPRRGARHEELAHVVMAELRCHVHRRPAEAERPAVDVERRHERVAGRVHAGAEDGRVLVDQTGGEREIAEPWPP